MRKTDLNHLGRTLFVGTADDDSLLGTDGNDLIKGLDGDDTLKGGTGNDRLVGGAGDDMLNGSGALLGGVGNDQLFGGGSLYGGAGDDRLEGDAGARLDGGAGVDYIFVDLWSETASETLMLAKQAKGHAIAFSNGTRLLHIETGDIHLGSGNDVVDIGKLAFNIWGGPGDDLVTNHGKAEVQIWGGAGDDTVVGGRGLDWVLESGGNDVLSGGAGDSDLLDYYYAAAGVTVDLRLTGPQDTGGDGIDTISGFENLRGCYDSDRLTGDDRDNIIEGEGGHDTLVGGGGDDHLSVAFSTWPPGGSETTLIGGAGRDVMTGGDDADTFVYQAVSDSDNNPDLLILGHEGVHDLVDVSAIDADVTKAGDQAFHKVDAFSGRPAELVLAYVNGSTWLTVDVDGDAKADMSVEMFSDVVSLVDMVL